MDFKTEQETIIKNQDLETTKTTDITEVEHVSELDFDSLSPEEKIERWHELYDKIYLSVYDEHEFVWRKIKRREYTEIMNNTPEENIDDVVEFRQYLTLKACVLSPHNENELDELIEEYPGLLTSLSSEILKKSGFSKPLTLEI